MDSSLIYTLQTTQEAIKIIKEKKDLTWLTDRGIVPLQSQKQRRTQIVEHILKERNNEVA